MFLPYGHFDLLTRYMDGYDVEKKSDVRVGFLQLIAMMEGIMADQDEVSGLAVLQLDRITSRSTNLTTIKEASQRSPGASSVRPRPFGPLRAKPWSIRSLITTMSTWTGHGGT